MTDQAFDLGRLEQSRNSACQLPDDARPPLLHGGNIHLDAAGLDAVFLELVFGAVIELRRFKQGFGRDAAGIQAGAAERVLSIPVLPFIDARDRLTVLGCTNCGDVTSRAGADDNYVKTSAH